MFPNRHNFYLRGCKPHPNPPSWRTTPCRLFEAAYSIYSQLRSTAGGRSSIRHAVATGNAPNKDTWEAVLQKALLIREGREIRQNLWTRSFLQAQYHLQSTSKSKLSCDRWSVGQLVLVSDPPGIAIAVGHLRSSCCPAWREDGSNSLIHSDPSPSYLSPPTWRARFPHLYPPGTGWPSYTPGHWVPFTSSLTTRRASVEVF
jgi:hypothetical protein